MTAQAQPRQGDWTKEEASTISDVVSANSIIEERGARYGAFSGCALITQELKAVMRNTPGWSRLNDSQAEALEMVAHKISRILNGDPNWADSWVDIAGYAELVNKQLNGVDA